MRPVHQRAYRWVHLHSFVYSNQGQMRSNCVAELTSGLFSLSPGYHSPFLQPLLSAPPWERAVPAKRCDLMRSKHYFTTQLCVHSYRMHLVAISVINHSDDNVVWERWLGLPQTIKYNSDV
jgi:hypothetical protein